MLLVVLIIMLGAIMWLINRNKETPQTENVSSVPAMLYATYKNGQISECLYNGSVVYSAGMNVYDGGGVIVDAQGNTIDTIIGMNGRSENGIAEKITNCTRTYVVEGNIWGFPAVNSLGLK